MAKRVLHTSKRYFQSSVDFLIDDGLLPFTKAKFKLSKVFWNIVERYFKRAMVIVANKARTNLTSMRAVATGFMRANIVTVVSVNMSSPVPIEAKVGTMAWYDILVEKGLGPHSPSGYFPAKYKPTPEQLAIVPVADKGFWKPSTKKPRPFLSNAIRSTRKQVVDIFKEGFRVASFKMHIKRGKPRHSLTTLR